MKIAFFKMRLAQVEPEGGRFRVSNHPCLEETHIVHPVKASLVGGPAQERTESRHRDQGGNGPAPLPGDERPPHHEQPGQRDIKVALEKGELHFPEADGNGHQVGNRAEAENQEHRGIEKNIEKNYL